MEKTFRVRAGDGREVTLLPTYAVDTNIRKLTDQDVVTVRDHYFTRRCLRNGDFVEVVEPNMQATDPLFTADAGDTPRRRK